MNIRVDLNYAIKDGTEVVFRSPVDCSQVTGLKVYSKNDGSSKEFAFADAHGNNVGDIDHLFAENVVVKVILDVTTGMAFVQNADTNAYIERTFVKTVNGIAPDENGNVVVEVPEGGGGSGEPGADGFSPVANVTQTDSGAVISITDKSGTTTATIVNGKDGVDGKDGKDGAQGVQGEKGETGAQGVQGEKGEKGETGAPGADGAKGEKGDTGAQGEPGKDGAPGKDGVSATHSWNGTTLTITSASGTSSANLKGEKGDKGDTGEQGIQGEKGDKGDKGDTGEQGIQGDKGDKGDTGASGTSVTVKSVSESTADSGSNVVTFSDGKTLTVKNGSKGSTGATGSQGPKGDTGATGATGATGQRGTGLLAVTTAPSGYTTEVGGITPKYRMAISTIKTQAGVTEVLLGDTIRYSYYHYPIAYLDASYAYFTTRVSIRGAAGTTPVKGVDYFDGTDGNDGYTPVRGVDYWTSADKAEIEAHIATELAKRGQLMPEYADSIEKCTDTTKLYVLPDGFIYAYILTEKVVESGGGDYTNILPLAVNADGTPYVGNNGEKGYKTDTRLNSSKAEVAQSGMCCTGFMPITPGQTGTLRFKDITPRGTQGNYVYLFGSDRSTGKGANSAFSDALVNSYDSATGVYTLVLGETAGTNGVTVGGINDLSSAAYLRISLGNINENTIITWNEEITEKSTEIIKEYAWASTGLAFVPADYEDRIIALEEETAQNTADIAVLKNGAVDTGGVDALTWIRNWDTPIYDRVPVFQLSAENPAVTSSEKTVDAVYAKYDALMAANSRYITKTNMGMCSDGVTPVYRYDFCEPEPHHQSGMQWSETKPTIIIVSGIHIEWGGIYSLYYALKEITENPELDDLRRNVHFVVVPVMNPYCIVGAYSTTFGVQNANGVEIHRNFEVGFKYPGESGYIEPGNRSHGGTEPLSEVETQYIDNLFKEFPDAALFMTCHSAQRDTRWGTGFIWASTATEYTCNLGYRLVDKLSKAWHKKYGTTWEEGCVRENEYVLADPTTYPNGVQLEDGDYRAGHAHVSSTNGTETRQATKYGIQGANVEVLDTFWVLSSTSLDSKLTTHGAEVYINYLLMYMGCYDHKDKKQYYIG